MELRGFDRSGIGERVDLTVMTTWKLRLRGQIRRGS